MKRVYKTMAVLLSLLLLSGCAAGPAGQELPAGTAGEESREMQPAAEILAEPARVLAIEAEGPAPEAEELPAEEFLMGDAHWDWWEAQRERINESTARQEGMERFYEDLLGDLLATEEQENAVCSPLNIYLALSMLAESSDGNTRDQILNVLQAGTLGELRSRVRALLDANEMDTPAVKSLPAASLWLRDDLHYHEETLQRLTDEYDASSYRGEMGSEAMDRMLQEWTDEHTGGLLKEYTGEMNLQPETVMALVSAIYFKAAWSQRFAPERTEEKIFHGAAGDTPVPMMRRDDMMPYYRLNRFRAVSLGLSDSGSVCFFLPEEGTDVRSLAGDPDVIRICRGMRQEESSYPLVHLTVPKFEVSGKTDLMETLARLGITDAADPELADFSPLTSEAEKIWLDKAEHAAMVKMDEEGVTGAAYTELAMAGAGMPQLEVDFTLDRPFFFAVTAADGSILFAGILQTIK